jgi:Rrf2 family cysteine metabolism transcriptional repressor
MKVSLKATYGILAALDLALQNGAAPVQAKAIARRQAIPVRFLEQVLNAMKRAGIVESVRGVYGGYMLTKQPDELSLAEIVEALDGPLTPTRPRRGASSLASARLKMDSVLAPVWQRLREAELAVLNTVTLTELVDSHRQNEQKRALMYHI